LPPSAIPIPVIASLILGLIVGIPYYGLPYFYDYFEQSYGWSRPAILLGLPLGTLVTVLTGPLLLKRVPPRTGVIAGAVGCAVAISGLGLTRGNLDAYYLLWILYMAGWSFSGPMAHQVLLPRLLARNRGSGLAIAFFGVSLFGAFSVAVIARPFTSALGFEHALVAMGSLLLLAAPLARFGYPDLPPAHQSNAPHHSRSQILRNRTFWLLTIGSSSAAAGIAGIAQHLKLILRERGYTDQARLDEVFGISVLLMLAASASGRFLFAWGADRFPKRHIITAAFVFMLCAMPLLATLHAGRLPYLCSPSCSAWACLPIRSWSRCWRPRTSARSGWRP
jgi:MFS family permease